MIVALYITILLFPLLALSQTLVEESRVLMHPASRDEVTLYSTADCQHCYYYLPSSLRVSASHGIPGASLVVIKDEVTERPTGGILHVLVEWGLKPGCEEDVQTQLRSVHDSLAVIMGPVMIDTDPVGASIEGKDRLSAILMGCLKNRPATPNTPGAKMALSFRFAEADIDDFLFYLRYPEKSKAVLRMNYSYAIKERSGDERSVSATLWLSFADILKVLK
jgi:hypothetical protein